MCTHTHTHHFQALLILGINNSPICIIHPKPIKRRTHPPTSFSPKSSKDLKPKWYVFHLALNPSKLVLWGALKNIEFYCLEPSTGYVLLTVHRSSVTSKLLFTIPASDLLLLCIFSRNQITVRCLGQPAWSKMSGAVSSATALHWLIKVELKNIGYLCL